MANRTRRTAKKDEKLFAALATGETVGVACKAAGYSRRSVYEYRNEDEEFARRWQEADDEAVELMEAEADRRATKGTLKPVFYLGVKCGEIREFSDTLLIFRLKAKRPDLYRERASIDHSGQIATSGVLVVPGMVSAEEWQEQHREREDAGKDPERS